MSTNARAARGRMLIVQAGCVAALSLSCGSEEEWVSHPVRMRLEAWQQFADSCVGKFSATTPLGRAIALELEIADSTGGLEVTPEVRMEAVTVGDRFDFLVTETRCGAVRKWRVREQARK